MGKLMALSISTAVFCGIWTQVSTPLGLVAWMGFASCTTYFASGKHGLEGMFVTMRQNLFGILCGLTIIFLGNAFHFSGDIGIYSGIVTFIMCIAGKLKFFAFIPGTFVGCYSTFASNGQYKALVFSLLIGAVLGVCCDKGGDWLYQITGKKPSSAES